MEKNILDVTNLNKRLTYKYKKEGDLFESKFELKDISFSLEPGYIMGVVGRNGAGKTTLINTILGLYRPDEGTISINGCDRVLASDKAKKEMAIVTDESYLPKTFTAHQIGKSMGPLYEEFDYDKFKELCKRMQIKMNVPAGKLSRGQNIKLQIAFAMSHYAKLYVFDEPTASLDPVFRKEFLELILEIVSDGNKSVFISTQLTEELDMYADYILYIDEGKQLFVMDKESLKDKYQLIKGSKEQINYYGKYVVGMKETVVGCEALISKEDDYYPVSVVRQRPTLDEIMTYLELGKKHIGGMGNV